MTLAGATAYGSAYFGQGLGAIFMDGVDCSGSETGLSLCPHTHNHSCDHSADASVICQPCKYILMPLTYFNFTTGFTFS